MKRLISLFLLLALLGCLDAPPKGQAQTANRAALVIQFDSTQVLTFCITFPESSISGHDLLQRSGLLIISAVDPLGYAVCKIDQLGCPEEDCFCQSPPNYWSYWHLDQGDWVYSPAGSSTYTIQNGAVDGWAWGPGPGYPPPPVTFDQICNPIPTPSNTPTATSTVTWTPKPSQTATATTPPTSTLSPTDTYSPGSAAYKPSKTPRQSAPLLQSIPTTVALTVSPVPTTAIPIYTPTSTVFPITVLSQSNAQLQVVTSSSSTRPLVTAQTVDKPKKKGWQTRQVEVNEIKIPAKATRSLSQTSKQALAIQPSSTPVVNSFPIQKLGEMLRYSIFGLLVIGLSAGLGLILFINRR